MKRCIDVDEVEAFLGPRHAELFQRAWDFSQRELAPLPRPDSDEAARVQAREILQKLGESGLLKVAHPLDLRACCVIRECVAYVSPLADEVFALQCLGSLPLSLAGSEVMVSRWLDDVRNGKSMAAFAMTEPDAGSDVAAMKTRARRQGDAYILDGEKTLISNAGIADFYAVFAKTDPEAGHRGISCFVVDKETPGLRFVGPQVLSAPHPLGRLAFEGCRVEKSALIGAEGEGFKLGMRTLDGLRTSVAAAAAGMGKRALDEALEHTTSRLQFGKPLAQFQMVQQRLAAMATELSAARLLTYRSANARDVGGPKQSLFSAMAKLSATESAQRIVDHAIQLIGGKALMADHPVDHLYRAVRPLRIYEGATDIQHIVIARALLKLYKDQ